MVLAPLRLPCRMSSDTGSILPNPTYFGSPCGHWKQYRKSVVATVCINALHFGCENRYVSYICFFGCCCCYLFVLLHSFNVYDRKLPNGICCVCASPIGMLVVPVSVFFKGCFYF